MLSQLLRVYIKCHEHKKYVILSSLSFEKTNSVNLFYYIKLLKKGYSNYHNIYILSIEHDFNRGFKQIFRIQC